MMRGSGVPRRGTGLGLTAVALCCVLAGCGGSAPEPEADPSQEELHSSDSSAPLSTSEPSLDDTVTQATIANWPPMVSSSTTVSSGLKVPWSVVEIGGIRVVSLRDSGKIVQINEDGSRTTLWTSTSPLSDGEGGLLGLAHATGGGLYVYETHEDFNRVLRFNVTKRDETLELGEPTVLLDNIPTGVIHNGGRLAFGPDGYLYVSTGDTGTIDGSLSQDPESLAGKILRITADGDIPSDNPFPGSPVWSVGHRNVQGLAWATDGTMFATEFGTSTWDELNIIEPGLNYGWPDVEGIAGVEGYQDPVQQWEPSTASPSGMAIRDDILFISHLRGEAIRAVPASNPNVSEIILSDLGRVRDVVLTSRNSLLALTSNTDGRGTPSKRDDVIVELEVTIDR